MNTRQKIMQLIRIMSGYPNENKEVVPFLYFDLSDSAWQRENVKPLHDFIA